MSSAGAPPRPRRRIVVAHLFPDHLNLYGDRGNVETLVRRASWRDIAVETRSIGARDGSDLRDADVIFIGGGSDQNQRSVAALLETIATPLERAIAGGAALLAVCGGYQSLGHAYRSAAVGELPGPGILDVRTEAPPDSPRLVGGAVIELAAFSPIVAFGRASVGVAGPASAVGRVVGFENHGGRTTLGPGVRPLGRVVVGHGNDDVSGYEGLIALPGQDGMAGLRIGTYLHGPILSRNPHLADYLLSCGIARGAGQVLSPLDDGLEWAAQEAFATDWIAAAGDGRRGSRLSRAAGRITDLIGF